MVGSCDVRFPIRLEGLASTHSHFCSYEPELFPGLIYRMADPKIVLLIFVSGKVVLTGAKTRDDIYRAFENIYPVLQNFKKGAGGLLAGGGMRPVPAIMDSEGTNLKLWEEGERGLLRPRRASRRRGEEVKDIIEFSLFVVLYLYLCMLKLTRTRNNPRLQLEVITQTMEGSSVNLPKQVMKNVVVLKNESSGVEVR